MRHLSLGILYVMVLFLLPGCSHAVKSGPLTDYGNALNELQETLPRQLAASQESPLSFAVARLSQEPSTACQEYAAALRQVLSSYDIPVAPPDRPPQNGPLDPVSEARIDALTHLLVTNLSDKESGRLTNLRWDVLTTVATKCPTGSIIYVLSNLPPDPDSHARRGAICRLVFDRLLDETRPPSASVAGMLLGLRLVDFGPVYVYGETLENPKGTELSDLLRKMERQIQRQMPIDRSAIKTQLQQSRHQAAQLRKTMQLRERNLATLNEDKMKLYEFVDVLWKNDAPKINEYVTGELAEKWPELRKSVFRANAQRFQVYSVNPQDKLNHIHILLKVYYADGFSYEPIALSIDRSHGWHLREVLNRAL